MNKDIYIILGPTAIGKTEYSLKLANEINAEIISSDAFQVYRYMDIGTGKVSKEIQARIPHHLIDIKYPDENYSVQEFITLCTDKIKYIRKKNKPIIIVGGTLFYLNAFIYDYKLPINTNDYNYRQELEQRLNQYGVNNLWEELIEIDPNCINYIDSNNPRRIIRALEIYYLTKAKPSEIRFKQNHIRSDIQQIIGLTSEREILYNKINQRVEKMFEEGFIEEVQNLIKMGYQKELSAFKAIGYSQICDYLNGSICKEEVIKLVQKQTRNFAKRQITWQKQFKNVKWITID